MILLNENQIKNSFNDDQLVNSCFSSNKYFGNESIFLETLGFFRSKYASAKARYYSENYIKSKFPEVWKSSSIKLQRRWWFNWAISMDAFKRNCRVT